MKRQHTKEPTTDGHTEGQHLEYKGRQERPIPHEKIPAEETCNTQEETYSKTLHMRRAVQKKRTTDVHKEGQTPGIQFDVKTDLYHMKKDMPKRQIAHSKKPTKETHATCKEITKRDTYSKRDM